MTDQVDGLALVERAEQFGRTRLALVDTSGGFQVDACALTIDPLELYGAGGATVAVGGIGNVETLESHRRRGLASKLVEVAIERMRADGFAASLLYGIDGFYDRFGWISCGDERWVTVELDTLGLPDPSLDRRYDARAMQPGDREQLADVYEQLAGKIPGAASRRSGRAWSQLRESEVLVVELDGVIHGWAWRGAGDVPERDSLARRNPGCIAYAEVHATEASAMLALLDAVSIRERADHPRERTLVTGACDGSSLRGADLWFDGTRTDETRRRGGAMLLEFDEAAAAPIDDVLYQFLPDRF